MTLAGVLGIPGLFGWIAVVLMGAFWFILTVFILCIMEVRLTPLRAEAASFGFRLLTAPFFVQGLSAFLHALRLHWVEANSKHYEAGGYVSAFLPVSAHRWARRIHAD